jgi:hypothetical protein
VCVCNCFRNALTAIFIVAGVSFEGVSTMLHRQSEIMARISCGGSLPEDKYKANKAFRAASKQLVRDFFMHDFRKKRPMYEEFLKKCNPLLLSIDHTFRIRQVVY